MSIPPAPPGLSEHYSSPVFQRQPRHYAAYNPQKSHAACFAGKIVMFEVGSRKTLSAWCEQGKKMQEYLERNTLLACRPASARLEITGLRSPRGVGCRGEGRALASAVQHTRPSMQKMVTAGCPCGPGRRPVVRAWPSRHLSSEAAAGGGLLRCNSDQDGRTGTFLGCVRLLVKTCARRNTAHLHPLCAQRTSLRASDSPDKAQHQLSHPKLRIPIP